MATATPALDRLRAQERAGLLADLLDTHPELAEELEARALARIRDVDADALAQHLKERLRDLPLAELAARAGRQPCAYIHETDAAYEIMAEALAPYEEDLWRAVALDLRDVAATILLGIVDGLHRCRDARDATVLAYAGEDTPFEQAAWLVDQAHDAGIELDRDEVKDRCPDWILLPDGLRVA